MYDRSKKYWQYNDLFRVLRSISKDFQGRKPISEEDLIRFLIQFLELVISDVVSSVLTKAFAKLIVQLVRAVLVVGVGRIQRVLAVFGGLLALIEFAEGSERYKISEPLA